MFLNHESKWQCEKKKRKTNKTINLKNNNKTDTNEIFEKKNETVLNEENNESKKTEGISYSYSYYLYTVQSI